MVDKNKNDFGVALAKVIRRAVVFLVYKGLRLVTSWLLRQCLDHAFVAIAMGAVLSVLIGGTAITWHFREGHPWGDVIATALRWEAAGEKEVEQIRAQIRNHPDDTPKEFRWTRGPSNEWKAEDERLHQQLSVAEGLVPSVLSPVAPPIRWKRPPDALGKATEFLYDAHHFLFDSIWVFVVLGYLGLGVPPAWEQSQATWRFARWRGERRTREHILFLGLDDDANPHFVTAEHRNHHILISGTTGSGKTEAMKSLAFHDLRFGRGFVFIDMKGDRALAEQIYAACLAHGRQDDFLFFSLGGEFSHSYNPLASGDAMAKRDRILSACTWSEEAFYRNEAKAALSRVLAALETRGTITAYDLYRVFDDKRIYAQVGKWAAPEDRPKFERDLSHWEDFCRNLSGLRANLHEFASARDRLCVAHADIDFREVHARNRIVYFELNSQMRPEAARAVARMLLEDLKHQSGTLAAGDESNRTPFSVYIDEARQAVYEGFIGFMTQCRSAGIGLTLATQSPLDFDGKDGPVTLAVTQNTATKILFCQRDPESASFCAALGGTYTTQKETTQVTDDAFGRPEATGLRSQRDADVFHGHPNDLKALPRGRAFLVQEAVRAMIYTRYSGKPSKVPFKPTTPRKWELGDPERLGHGKKPLGIGDVLNAPPGSPEPPGSKKKREAQ
jgi:hypothetical protein